jgi:hypothetical protein
MTIYAGYRAMPRLGQFIFALTFGISFGIVGFIWGTVYVMQEPSRGITKAVPEGDATREAAVGADEGFTVPPI